MSNVIKYFAEKISLTTDATSAITGALQVSGGASIAKALWLGGTSASGASLNISYSPTASQIYLYGSSSSTVYQNLIDTQANGNLLINSKASIVLNSVGNVQVLNGLLSLTNGTSNVLQFGNAGFAPPNATSRSSGTKIVLCSSTPSYGEYAFGIDSATLWYSVDSTLASHKWYAGATNLMTLSGTGDLAVIGYLNMGNYTTPCGISTEVGGTNPIVNLEVNFRAPAKNNTYPGAAIRVDSRSGNPPFVFLYRSSGSAVDNTIATINSSGVFSTTSDAKVKSNIRNSIHGLDTVRQLQPRTYKYKNREDEVDNHGFVAQEIEKVIPELVVNQNDGLKGIMYTSLIPILTKSIQEMDAVTEELKSRIEQVERFLEKNFEYQK